MNLTRPFDKSTLVQGFGTNAVDYNKLDGLIGHPGQDYAAPYGSPIPVVIDGSYCYATLSKNNTNLMAYRAVCTLYEDVSGVYEIIYGHCSAISAIPGNTYWEPDTIAQVGNTGDVFVGTQEVTEASKLAGSHDGTHLHFQVRAVVKVLATSPTEPGVHYLNDGNGQLQYNGYKYKWKYEDNGYNSCIDPEPFFTPLQVEPEDVRKEIEVLKSQTDPQVRKGFIDLIITQLMTLLGYK